MSNVRSKTLTNIGATNAIKRLYLDETLADVYFCFDVIGDKPIKIPAHKIILSSQSPVFHTMFYGSIQEGNEINIVDASPFVFKQFLQFFYLPEVTLTMEHVAFVMNLGKKYEVYECLEVCSTFIMSATTVNDVCSNYELARFFGQQHLIKFCEAIFKFKTSEILSTSDFLYYDRKYLHNILGLGFTCPARELIKAFFEWSKSECQRSGLDENQCENLKEKLKELLYKLPFNGLKLPEFLEVIEPNVNIFTPDELFEVMQIVSSENFKPKKFVANPIIPRSGVIINCDRVIKESFVIKNIETTTFSSNKAVLLHGFSCSNVYDYNAKKYSYFIVEFPTSSIKMIEKAIDADIVLFRGAIKLVTHGENRFDMYSPILIRPEIKYEIQLEQPSQPNYYTFLTLKSTLHIGADTVITFHPDKNLNYDNTATGLINGLRFGHIG